MADITPKQAHSVAPRKGGKSFIGIVAGLALLAVLLVMGILPRMRQKNDLIHAQTAADSAPSVEFVTPHPAPGNTDLLLPGSVQAVEQANVNARTSGYVSKRFVDIGSRVRRGDTLALIETPEVDQQLAQAEADKAKSQAVSGQAQADVQRLRVGILQAQSEVKRFEANLRQSQAAEKRAEAHLIQVRAARSNAVAKVQQAREMLGQRTADLAQRKADLAQNEATLDIAGKTLARWKQLAKNGAVAAQDVDERQATYDQRKAVISASNAAISSAQAAIGSAQADLEAAQANVEAADADIEATKSDLDAAKSSVKGAQAALRSSQTNVLAARSSVNVGEANTRAQIAGVGSSQANVARIAALQEFKKVVAPFDGVITARNVDTGALVKADNTNASDNALTTNSGLFGIARTDVLKIQVSVPQTYAGSIRDGMVAQVLIREYPGRVFAGTVKRSAGALSATTRTLLTEIQISNGDKALLPGMYAQVKFTLSGAHSALRIPSNTLIVNADGTQAATVTHDGTVHFIPVTIGKDYGSELDITSGLVGNEQIITNPSDGLQEGMKVDAKAAKPEPPPASAPKK